MCRSITIILSLIFITAVFSDDSDPIVDTKLGKIRGSILKSRLNRDIYSFRGIRYAEPPIGDLRFQPPVAVSKLSDDGDIYNATQDASLCPQPDFNNTSEDCLFLNIYTPILSRNASLPVLVYIHAGGYYSVGGSSDWAGPQYLLDHDLILVTINYRLGSLGFLSTGTKEAPGNNGLKDQVLALKFIQDNIDNFGGNRKNVTISGYSAGGVSVILHLISPMSRGLFHKAIVQSGSGLAQWEVPDNLTKLALKQAELVNCPENKDNITNLVECLKQVSADDLGNSLDSFFEYSYDPVILWTPVVEKDFGQERFLIEHPIDSILKGDFAQVPIIVGLTKDEFAARAWTVLSNETLRTQFNDNFTTIAPIALLYERDTDNSKHISDKLREFYFNGGELVANSSLDKVIEMYAEGTIGFGVHRAVTLLAQKSTKPVYYYRFKYKGRYSHFYKPGTNIPFGTVHHDDLIYLYYIKAAFPYFQEGDQEIPTVEKYTKMWSNFVNVGNPTPEKEDLFNNIQWPVFDLETQKFLDFGDEFEIGEKLYKERYDVWDELFPINRTERTL